MREAFPIKNGQKRYVGSNRSDLLFPMFRTLTAGFDLLESQAKADGPLPHLDSLAISMTISGEADLYTANGRIHHRPGSMMLLLPNLLFHEIACRGPWQSCWIVFAGPAADTFVEHSGHNGCALAIEHVPGNIRLDFLEATGLIFQQPSGWKWKWLTKVFGVMGYILGEIRGNRLSDSLASRAKTLMENHLANPLLISEIAEKLNTSESQFSHQFRRENGVPPGQFYRRIRIDHAKQLLANGFRIGEISRQMGFENQFHFSRLFKQITGISPSQFVQIARFQGLRKKAKGEAAI